MKNTARLFCLGLLPVLFGRSAVADEAAPASPAQLQTALETAIDAGDTNGLLVLMDWHGVAPDMKSELTDVLAGLAGLAGPDTAMVKLLPLPGDY